MLLIYSVMTIISILLLALIFIFYYIENELQNELNIHSEVIFNIEKILEEQDRISNSVINGINTQDELINEINILNNYSFEEYLNYKLDKYSVYNKQIDLKYLIDTILSNKKDALAVVINDKNKEFRSELVLNYTKWYEKKYQNNNTLRVISKPIIDKNFLYTLGYMDIYFDLSDIKNLLKNSKVRGILALLDENNNILYSSDNEKVLNYIKENKTLLNKSNIYKNNIYKNESLVSVRVDTQSNFKYLSIIELKDLNIFNVKFKIFSLSLFCVIIILIITYIIISEYSFKLKRLVSYIKRIEDGDLDARLNIEKEDDELDMIAMKIDHMSESLKYNINKNYISEVKQKQAELSALQAQIKPHFLYNMLEVIRMCSLSKGNVDVADMIYSLAGMFRYSTYNNGSMVSINQEIKYCKMYLDLCCKRYRGIFKYKINISEDIKEYIVPKFILQPIVENSINHGIKKDLDNNLIEINIKEKDKNLEISIDDNGLGISKENLEKINENLKKNLQKTESIGLMNINNRIKLKFGEDYGIYISSELNNGTTVKIKLPILKDGDEIV